MISSVLAARVATTVVALVCHDGRRVSTTRPIRRLLAAKRETLGDVESEAQALEYAMVEAGLAPTETRPLWQARAREALEELLEVPLKKGSLPSPWESPRRWREVLEAASPARQRAALEGASSGGGRAECVAEAAEKLGGGHDAWRRVEAFDVSHMRGRATVVSCARLVDGAVEQAALWRPPLGMLTPGDDYGALHFAAKERALLKPLPCVVVVDGGRAQVSAVASAFDEVLASEEKMPTIIGLAKGDRGNVVAKRDGEKIFDSELQVVCEGDDVPRLARLARDAAHASALHAHRRLRDTQFIADLPVVDVDGPSSSSSLGATCKGNEEEEQDGTWSTFNAKPFATTTTTTTAENEKKKKKARKKAKALDALEVERLRRIVDRVVGDDTLTAKRRLRRSVENATLAAEDGVEREATRSSRRRFVDRGEEEAAKEDGGELRVTSPLRLTEPQREAVEAVEKRLDDPDAGGVAVLQGATGTGKTFCMASLIAKRNAPALVLAPNKVLAAQLYDELAGLFPGHAVQYFVSFYDYYRPESFAPNSATFMSKRSAINSKLDELRHSTTTSLSERRDVIVVASVSCVYGLGVPESYERHVILVGDDLLAVVDEGLKGKLGYQQEPLSPERPWAPPAPGHFTARHFDEDDVVVAVTAAGDGDVTYALKFEDGTLAAIARRRAGDFSSSGSVFVEEMSLWPATHHSAAQERKTRDRVCRDVERELRGRVDELLAAGKPQYAERLEERTLRDLELLRETGTCPGIENYSRHFAGSEAGEPPVTLLDYFPPTTTTHKGGPPRFLLICDESHLTIAQLGAMYHGDRARKQNLVDYGFRLPSAMDNRPLKADEFWSRVEEAVLVSATPGKNEGKVLEARASTARCRTVASKLVVRPTLICDPAVAVRPRRGQLEDALYECRWRAALGERSLVLASSVAQANLVAEKFNEVSLHDGGVPLKVAALTGRVKPKTRISLLADLKSGTLDVLVGVQLLREGIDLPECSLVAILDADNEGFLRSDVALVQNIGRAARHVRGNAILYADRVTNAMRRALDETDERRHVQQEYNRRYNVSPRPLVPKYSAARSILDILNDEAFDDSADPGTPGFLRRQHAAPRKRELARANAAFETTPA